MPSPKITLYTVQTPNGVKVSIALEELGLPFTVKEIDPAENEQKSEWFTKINPNGRIPAITDTLDDGTDVRVFESGAILQYLVQRYDGDHRISYPPGTKEWAEMTAWLHFQMAGVGPMQGQANHFARYAGEKIEYGVKRYTDKVRRLYGVMNEHLRSTFTPYFVGDKCTIADIAIWGWVALSPWCYVDLSEFPALQVWEERMLARPGVEKGRHVPQPHHRELVHDKAKMDAQEKQAREFYRKMEQEEKERSR